MSEELQAKLSSWMRTQGTNSEDIANVKAKVDQLEHILYETYEPTLGGQHPLFRSRLLNWINSVDGKKDQQTLFLMFQFLFFVGKKEIESCLYSVLERAVTPWLFEQCGQTIFEEDTGVSIGDAIDRTLFTGLTESFPLRKFLTLNNIDHHPNRYIWLQGAKDFDDTVFTARYMQNKDYIVLMEDFVGTGGQVESLITQACNAFRNIPILYVPLIICPDGDERGHFLSGQFQNLSYSPILVMPPRAFLKENSSPGEYSKFSKFRDMVLKYHAKVSGSEGSWPNRTGAFGHGDTGAFVVKYDNCPDNTLPVFHHSSDLGWNAIFKRNSRE